MAKFNKVGLGLGILFILGLLVMEILSMIGEINIISILLSNNLISSRDQVINNNNMYNFIFMSIVLNFMIIIIEIIKCLMQLSKSKYLFIIPLFIYILYLVGLIFILEFFINKNNDIVHDNVKLGFMGFTAGLMILKFIIIFLFILYNFYKVYKNKNKIKE